MMLSRNLKMETKMKKYYKSVFDNEQELLKAFIDIHLDGKDIELDPMYFKGNFYKGIKEPKYKFDISPIVLGVKKADARRLPLENESITSMILDPPFMFGIHGKTKEYYSSSTHGILQDFEALKELYQSIIREAYRVLKTKGILIFKCQDYTDNKTTMTHCFVWQWAVEIGFYPKDLAILNIPQTKITNPNLTQRHLRKTHCYFWVFKK